MKKKSIPHVGMPGIRISIDLQMPQPPGHEEPCDIDDLMEDDVCETCGELHPEGECTNSHNMRTGPLPELQGKKPIVDSEYLRRIEAQEKANKSKGEKK
jgi:hypothetical protein